MVNFLKKAIELSYGKDYELIWKWPDICHDKLIKALNKVRGILNKMHYSLPIMSANFNAQYGPYSMNIANNYSINSLENYKLLTLSVELNKSDYADIISNCQNPDKIEMLVQGSVELMKTRYPLLYGRESENAENYLIDRNRNNYPIHTSISNEELIIFSDSELSLLDDINDLKNLGFCNFSIDGRYKDDDYCKIIDVFKEALNGNVSQKELRKYSLKNTLANF